MRVVTGIETREERYQKPYYENVYHVDVYNPKL